MATSLALQLAALRGKGANPLDLKTQKINHSQSLLFDPFVAATQEYDSIYAICNEGFHELCQLDPRFTAFRHSIFSEQSIREDRTQMSSVQNDQLNTALEDFLRLVGSRLLLKPALKAVEWLVRRFRVQEHNTLCLAMTFLPYHSAPIFRTLLSILPVTLLSELRFLHPYIQSLQNPPRHAIVYTATSNKAFFTRFNVYFLEVCKLGYSYPALIVFWATTVTEAVAAILDQSRSGRPEAQRQNQENMVFRVIPVLNAGLSMQDNPDLHVGCYMILTVLVKKCALEDKVLAALLEATASGLSQTKSAGLICLAITAEQQVEVLLPKRVLSALLKLETLDSDLRLLKLNLYNVEKLVLGIILGIVDEVSVAQEARYLRLVRVLIEADLLDESKLSVAITHIILATQTCYPGSKEVLNVQASLMDLLLSLSEKETVRPILKASPKLDMRIREAMNMDEHALEQEHMGSALEPEDQSYTFVSFENAMSRIPVQTALDISFLSHSDSSVFDSLARAFLSAFQSSANLKTLCDLLVLGKSLSMSKPLYFSFFVRIWCSHFPAAARAAAIAIVSEGLRGQGLITDPQFLIPYIIYGLADPSHSVRSASANLVITLSSYYNESKGKENKQPNQSVLGRGEVYGQGYQSGEVVWLSWKEATKFLKEILEPSLEECLLDANHILRYLPNLLLNRAGQQSSGTENAQKKTKTPVRQAIFAFLCSHVVSTPVFRVKFLLLKILNEVEKVGTVCRTKALLPLLSERTLSNTVEIEVLCNKHHISLPQFLDRLVGIVSPSDSDGVHILESILTKNTESGSLLLLNAAHQRIRGLWLSLNSNMQLALARSLLEVAVDDIDENADESWRNEYRLTLMSVSLSTSVLQSFLESLSFTPDNSTEPSSLKRRRGARHAGTTILKQDPQSFRRSIRKSTFVMELIEACQAEKHPQLLRGLFQVMSKIQQLKDHSGMDMGYLEVLVMGNISPIIKRLELSPSLKFDQTAIKPNVLIDCLRTTKSFQAQQTALLLISSLASVTSDLVLHSIMPVFTFMGDTILRQNDDFSAYVVAQTMESVIPRLVKSLHTRNENPTTGTMELLFSFVAAFEHIPSPRRLGLFKSLVDKLGNTEFLFALLVLLLDKYPDNAVVRSFGADLIGAYDALTQLQTVEKCVTMGLDILTPNPTIGHHHVPIVGVYGTENAVMRMLPLLTAILQGKNLIQETTKILKGSEQVGAVIRDLCTQLLEKLIKLSSNTKDRVKFEAVWKQVLDSLLCLLPNAELLNSFQSLLMSAEDEVRLQVLSSFQQRFILDTFHSRAMQKASLEFLPRLTGIWITSSSVPLKHAVLACVGFISDKFGQKDVPALLDVAKAISTSQAPAAVDMDLEIAILLCLATIVHVVRDEFVPLIPIIFPKALDHLSASVAVEDTRLHNAVYSFICALLLHVPWIITKKYMARLLEISYQSANAELGKACNDSRAETLKLAAKQIQPEHLFYAMDQSWKSAMANGPNAVKDYFFTFCIIIERQPKSAVVKQSEILSDILIKAFDLRRIQFSPDTAHNFSDDEVEDAEAAIFSSTVTMIYKLSDATFRPMFSKMWEWATNPTLEQYKSAKQHRRTTLYAFLGVFFQMFKSIVTGYTSFIVNDVVEILHEVSLDEKHSITLWRRVITVLRNSFEHDQEEFWQSPDHFGPISESLLAQVARASQHPQIIISDLIPAIIELAVVANSTNHHRSLNSAILLYTRSDDPTVRLMAVRCELSLTERLGEEWLALLPEMLPFIGELQEDDDEAVEGETFRWIRKVEEVLGERLAPMLQ